MEPYDWVQDWIYKYFFGSPLYEEEYGVDMLKELYSLEKQWAITNDKE